MKVFIHGLGWKSKMSSIPKLYNNGSQLSRNLLNSSLTDLFHIQILSQHKSFVTDIKYFQNQSFSILTPSRTDLVTYILEHGYYNINISQTQLDLTPFSMFENIIEIYNISRNETYFMLQKDQNYQSFTQPCEFVDIIKDVETSLYRITGFISKKPIIDKLNFNIVSSYNNKPRNSMYFLKYIGNKQFSVYEIEMSEDTIITEINTLLRIIQTTLEENIDLNLIDLVGLIRKEYTITLNQNEAVVIDDITLVCGYLDTTYDYLQFLNNGDILYFYVNRIFGNVHNHDLTYERKSDFIVKTNKNNTFLRTYGNNIVENIMEAGAFFINWNLGNIQKLLVTSDLEIYFNTTLEDILFEQILYLNQDDVGNHSISFMDSNIKWINDIVPEFNISQNGINIIKISYDGINYYCELKKFN